jgi:hypothetical protein
MSDSDYDKPHLTDCLKSEVKNLLSCYLFCAIKPVLGGNGVRLLHKYSPVMKELHFVY